MAGERLTSAASCLAACECRSTESFPERTDAAVTSDTPLQQLLRAVVRFWWVARSESCWPGSSSRSRPTHVTLGSRRSSRRARSSTYSASTQLLITSKGEPYLSSTNVNAKIINLGRTRRRPSTTGTATGTQQASTYDSGGGADGDLQRLVEIAEQPAPARDERHRHPPAQQAVRAHQRHRHRRQPLRLLRRRRLPRGPAPVHQDHGHRQHAAGRDRHHQPDRAGVQAAGSRAGRRSTRSRTR